MQNKKKQKIIPPPKKIGVPPQKNDFTPQKIGFLKQQTKKVAARRHGTNQRHQPRALRLAPRGPVRHRGLRGAKRGHLAAGPRGVAGAEVLVVQALGNGYGSIPIDTFLVGWTSIYQLFMVDKWVINNDQYLLK